MLGMFVCLFGPTVFYTIIGYKALEQVGKRPSHKAAVLTTLITKLVLIAGTMIGILMALLRFFAPQK